ncbi:putative AlkP superfamily pyrophosphatase or phosphodiesterase [Isoptericola sp. CG 20/1183]|uniref:AlkP superfamily pyrophosphatase or phosphodiesterase n=1 Tax=Isoptericola halotolerans TaxID=300560 RepID=A0ABX5EHB9_9MICO|nr:MULTISPECIES: alkaline phosphatase family protein [Isoptericola]PRZ02880.1 putative AlkP superfamily pyrophosphatase or phosphodiesterase [Isoptericola sp. CG 20/1183]PRZ09877.1 putative AlkP superfamily pyrophosphatase or phosphodiesterase [Isoptericola halotolerans]
MNLGPRPRALAVATTLAGAVATTLGLVAPTAAAPSPAAERAPADHVVLLAFDGFDADYLELVDELPTPHLDRLVRRGSLTTSSGVMTTITNPSWSSVATGAWPERHLNTAYWFDPETNTARGQQRDLAVPTIAQTIRDQGGTVFSSQWYILQNYGTAYGDPDGLYTQPGGDCSRRVDDAVDVLRGEPVNSGGQMVTASGTPELLAVYCDTLDALGHAGGAENPAIPEALMMLDEQVGRVVDATKEAGIYGRTTFIMTGDHGMTTFDQGFGDEALAAIADTGYDAQILSPGSSPAAGTDVAIVVGGVASLHLVGDATGDAGAVEAIRAALEELPQVRAVYDETDQAELRMSPNYGELVVEPQPGWSFGATPSQPVGRHGASTELDVAFALAGAGVLPNRPPSDARHVDVAPTIAALLGIDPPSGAQGRVLTESVRVPE